MPLPKLNEMPRFAKSFDYRAQQLVTLGDTTEARFLLDGASHLTTQISGILIFTVGLIRKLEVFRTLDRMSHLGLKRDGLKHTRIVHFVRGAAHLVRGRTLKRPVNPLGSAGRLT